MTFKIKHAPILCLLTVGLLSLCVQSALAYTPGDPEFRGIWVTRFEWPSTNQTTCKNNIDSIMSNLSDHGFNAVVFQIRGQCDTLYPSPYEPWSTILGGSDPGWDPLAYAISSAHSNGLEFHAYINACVVWQSGSSNPPAHSTPEHPFWDHCNLSGTHDWLLCDSGGTPEVYGSDGYVWAAAGVPSFQEWVRKVTMHVVENYDIDGVHYDRIRFPANTYSYDPISNARRAGDGNPDGLGFKDWQRDQITRMLTAIYGEVMSVKPYIKMSCAPFGIFDRSRFSGYSGFTDAYDKWLQDAQGWAAAGCMDAIIPMIYWDIPDPAPNYDILLSDWTAYNYGRHIYGGMSASKYSFPELGNEVTYNRDHGANGHCPFSYGGLSSGEFDTFKSTYFTTDVDTPSMSWKDNPTTGIIIGTVKDSGGTEIVDAAITRSGSSYTTLSGYDGFYAILNVPPGTYTIDGSKSGVGTAQATGVTVTAGGVTTVNLTLSLDTPTHTPTGPTATPTDTTPPTNTPTETPTVEFAEIIIDDGDSGYSTTGVWTYNGSGGSEPYNSDYEFSDTEPSSETARAEWRPTITNPGYYDVFVRYRQGTNRPPDAPYTVYYDGGSQVVDVDQTTNGGTWVLLGNYAFQSGTGGYVTLSNGPCTDNKAAIADAVKWNRTGNLLATNTPTTSGPTNTPSQTPTVTPTTGASVSDIIIESRSGGQNYDRYSETGTWANTSAKSSASGVTGGIGSRYGSTYFSVAGAKSAFFTPDIATGGTYEVYATWGAGSSRRSPITFKVQHSGGVSEYAIDQTINADTWILIGEHTFNTGTGGHLEISNEDIDLSGSMYADAAKWVYTGPGPVTDTPTDTPSEIPTWTPTRSPSWTPTDMPTDTPTWTPTQTSTRTPTDTPTDTPSDTPTDTPTSTPTDVPTDTPTDVPTMTPTDPPTATPTDAPTDAPTMTPTDSPTTTFTDTPTDTQSPTHTASPTDTATVLPTPSYSMSTGIQDRIWQVYQ